MKKDYMIKLFVKRILILAMLNFYKIILVMYLIETLLCYKVCKLILIFLKLLTVFVKGLNFH